MFQNYKYFIEIVSCGSLSKAAERLFLTQPALSKYLKRLEQELQVDLFSRDGTALSLTYAGKQYFNAAMKIKKEEENFASVLNDIKSDRRNEISLGVSRWRSTYVLSKFVPAFQSSFPKIEIHIDVQNSGIILSELQSGKLDIAILNQWNTSGLSGLFIDKLFSERRLIAANVNHPLILQMQRDGRLDNYNVTKRRYPRADVASLRNEQFILLNRDTNETKQILSFFEQHNINPQLTTSAQNVNSLLYGVSCSKSFAFIPETGVSVNTIPKEVMFLSLDDNMLQNYIVAVTTAPAEGAPAIHAALAVLHNVFSPLHSEN